MQIREETTSILHTSTFFNHFRPAPMGCIRKDPILRVNWWGRDGKPSNREFSLSPLAVDGAKETIRPPSDRTLKHQIRKTLFISSAQL
jgi:hypothetical protein